MTPKTWSITDARGELVDSEAVIGDYSALLYGDNILLLQSNEKPQPRFGGAFSLGLFARRNF